MKADISSSVLKKKIIKAEYLIQKLRNLRKDACRQWCNLVKTWASPFSRFLDTNTGVK